MPQMLGPNGAPVRLFERKCTLDVGQGSGIRITGLRTAFRIMKSDKPETNKSQIQIWNLTPQHRTAVEVKGTRCVLSAGYPGNEAQIFSGEVHFAQSEKNENDFVTKIELGDGTLKVKSARVGQYFPPGTKLLDVVKHVGSQLVGDLGNLVAQVTKSAPADLSEGFTFAGSAEKALTRLLRSQGLNWSIQDGRIEALERSEFLPGQGPLISSSTGLIGSPAYGVAKKAGGPRYLQVKSLLQPALRPGQSFQLQSISINGTFRCHKVEHDGDTHAADWYSDIEAL